MDNQERINMLTFFDDKSIVRQEIITIRQKRNPRDTKGISLMILQRVSIGGVTEIVLTREELRKALKYIEGED